MRLRAGKELTMIKLCDGIYCSERLSPAAVSAVSSCSTNFSRGKKYVALLGFCDVHVHFREPGFSYKGTVYAGSRAAAAGGYTTVMTMPNLKPVPDCVESIKLQRDIIERDAVIDVYPYASITKGQLGLELSDMDELAPLCCAFSDDGRGVQSEEMMLAAMKRAKSLGKLIVAHCEDNSLLYGGYIHAGQYAKEHGHLGILSESEWGPIKRDLELVRKTGCSYHVCHISTKESVELIRQAKREGLDVTCETAPHYLILDDGCLEEDGRFKMNPPLRSPEDREALVRGLLDGTIDMIATDHAPHSAEDKAQGLAGSAFGVVGLEFAFSAMYTHFVKTGIITLERLEELMSVNPRKRFGIPIKENDFCVFSLDGEYKLDPEKFISLGRATPFAGHTLCGKCVLTVKDGKAVWEG